tara:strand:+ start:1987 stop:2262 length:276 start_codon:yes stop_codon:yes gene_type:complete
MFIGHTKTLFFQCMSDAKVGGPIEKSNILGIISALQLWLWVIQKMQKCQGGRLLCSRWCSSMFVGVQDFKFVCEGCSLRYRKKNYSRNMDS